MLNNWLILNKAKCVLTLVDEHFNSLQLVLPFHIRSIYLNLTDLKIFGYILMSLSKTLSPLDYKLNKVGSIKFNNASPKFFWKSGNISKTTKYDETYLKVWSTSGTIESPISTPIFLISRNKFLEFQINNKIKKLFTTLTLRRTRERTGRTCAPICPYETSSTAPSKGQVRRYLFFPVSIFPPVCPLVDEIRVLSAACTNHLHPDLSSTLCKI